MPTANKVIFTITETGKYAADVPTGTRGDINWNILVFPPFYGQYDGQVLTRTCTISADVTETYDIYPRLGTDVLGIQQPKGTYTYHDVWDSTDHNGNPLHWEYTFDHDYFLWDLTRSQRQESDGWVMTEQAQVICGAWGKCHHSISNVTYMGQALNFPSCTYDQVDDYFHGTAHGHGEVHVSGGGNSFSIACEGFEGGGYVFIDAFSGSFDFRFEGPFNVTVNPVVTDMDGTPMAGQFDVTLGGFYVIDPAQSDWYPVSVPDWSQYDLSRYKKRISGSTAFSFPIREVFHRCIVGHTRGDGTSTFFSEVPYNDLFNSPVRSSLTYITMYPVVPSLIGFDDPYLSPLLRPLMRFNADSGVTARQVGTVSFANEVDFSAPTPWAARDDPASTATDHDGGTSFHCVTSDTFFAFAGWEIRPYRYLTFDYEVTGGQDVSVVVILKQPSINPQKQCGPVEKYYRLSLKKEGGTAVIDTCAPFDIVASGDPQYCSLAAYAASRLTTQNNAEVIGASTQFGTLVEKMAGVGYLLNVDLKFQGAADVFVSNWKVKVMRGLSFNSLGQPGGDLNDLPRSHWGQLDGRDAWRIPAGSTPTYELNHLRDYQQFTIVSKDVSLPAGVWPQDITDIDVLCQKRFAASDQSRQGWLSNYDHNMHRFPPVGDLSGGAPVYWTVGGNTFQGYMGMGDSTMMDPSGRFTLNCELVLGNVVQSTVLSAEKTDITVTGPDGQNNPFTEGYQTDGTGNYGEYCTHVMRLGTPGTYHYRPDIRHHPKKDKNPQPQLLSLTGARVALWAGFQPGGARVAQGPWCLHDVFGRFYRVTTSDKDVFIERSASSVALPGYELTAQITEDKTNAEPRLAIQPLYSRLYVVYSRVRDFDTGAGDTYAVWSDDNGATWSDPELKFQHAKHPTVASSPDGTIVYACFRNYAGDAGPGNLYGIAQRAGEQPSAEFTFKDSDGSDIEVQDDQFHLSCAYDAAKRWVLVLTRNSSNDVTDWYSADNCRTWVQVTTS